MRHLRAICVSRSPRQRERFLASLRLLSLVAVVLVASIAAGCGGSGKSGAKTTSTGGSSTTTAATTSSNDQQDNTLTELDNLPLRTLQACPASGDSARAVAYHGLLAYADCGTGSAQVRVGNTSLKLEHGHCTIQKRGGVSYQFGTYVADERVPYSKRNLKLWFGPAHVFVVLGFTNITPSYKLTTGDGTYVDTPVDNVEKAKYGITIGVSGKGKQWEADLQQTKTMTLTNRRMRGSFTATAKNGEKMSGTFQCGNRIEGDGAPQP
jgi:hypothetical protein